jgi:hypothetical protein
MRRCEVPGPLGILISFVSCHHASFAHEIGDRSEILLRCNDLSHF